MISPVVYWRPLSPCNKGFTHALVSVRGSEGPPLSCSRSLTPSAVPRILWFC